ncbi:MAG: Fe-S cluster assembly protein SufD [Castellaniella sp.]
MSSAEQWIEQSRAQAGRGIGAGLAWLDAVRGRALERFAAEGWPGARQEGWRHTSLATLQQQGFAGGQAADAATVKAMVESIVNAREGHWLVFVDGRYEAGLSRVGSLPEGAHVMALSEAVKTHADAVQALFGDETQGASPAALNLAMGGDGGFIQLLAGVTLEQPVYLLFVSATPGGWAFPRNLIDVERGAHGTVVEHYIGVDGAADQASLTNAVTRCRVDSEAGLTHMKLQLESEHDFHLAALQASQGAGSVFNSHSMSFGARLARNDIGTVFGGERCETLLNGLYHVNGRRHVDHTTVIHHAHPQGTSREFYRGILDNAGRGVFGGRILVAEGADGTDAEQRSDSLLLSRMARADARPELEIYADDVKCAHGATVGQLDEDAMFYLRTRGFDDAHARNLLIYAFATEAIERIRIDSLRKQVAALVRARLPGGEALGELA